MIRVHEVEVGVCRHCNAVNPGADSTCVWRVSDGPNAASSEGGQRRVPAIEDFDFISARRRELEAEQAWRNAELTNLGEF